MVIYDFDLMRTVCFPSEANTPLVVDTDGICANSITFECLQAVSRWNPQLHEPGDSVKLG